MSFITINQVAEELYFAAQNRVASTEDVLATLISKLGLLVPVKVKPDLMELIRPYKLTGKDLELVADQVYNILIKETNAGLSWE